jgi:hypothetical protein
MYPFTQQKCQNQRKLRQKSFLASLGFLLIVLHDTAMFDVELPLRVRGDRFVESATTNTQIFSTKDFKVVIKMHF